MSCQARGTGVAIHPEDNAWTADGVIIGLKHKEHPVHGVQFHPESILTQDGKRILENFLGF